MLEKIEYPKRLARMTRIATVSAAVVTVLCSPVAVGAQEMLMSGQRHIIKPAQTVCLTSEVINSTFPAPTPKAEADCDTANGEASVLAEDLASLLAIEVIAASAFQYGFWIELPDGAAEPSFVPIHVDLSVNWEGALLNGHLSFEAIADLEIYLQLRQDPDLFPGGSRGVVLVRESILGATHRGLDGCVNIKVLASVSCALTVVSESLTGSGQVTLDAVVEVGRTYSLELVIRASTDSSVQITGLIPHPVRSRGGSGVISPVPGLKWDTMTLTIGTDPAAIVADLQEQIDQLREDLENHTHNYLTGPGVGHNNTLAISSPAIIPGTAATGKSAASLQSGPVTGPPAGAANLIETQIKAPPRRRGEGK